MSRGSPSRLLIVIGQVLSEPWLSITREGQFPTWIQTARDRGIPVRHSHGKRSGLAIRALDRCHEWIRWRGIGRSLVPRMDAAVGSRFLDRTPAVQVGQFVDPHEVSWQQNLVDVYALQRWKVVGSLTQALREDFTHVYFTTASSYVRIDELECVVESLPAEGLYAGTRHVDAISGCEFASGANRMLSRDVVELVLGNTHIYRNDVMEDVGLGRVVTELGVPLVELPSLNVSSEKELDHLTDAQLLDNFHFRMTSGPRHARRDAYLMRRLHARVLTLSQSSRVSDAQG